MTEQRSALELRQAEDAEFERKRRRSIEFIAFDMMAAQFGQAEWQRFSSREPLAFLRAKLDVQGGPPGLFLDVNWSDPYQAEFACRFEWRLDRGHGDRCRLDWGTTREFAESDDDLRWVVDSVAYMLTRQSEVPTRILVRSNRSAWEWHENHKNDPPPPKPRSLARLQRIAGEFCTCGARFRTEELENPSSGMLPCGHLSVGYWTEVST